MTPVADAEPTIRRATAEDADAIGRVQVETWRAAYSGLMPDEAVASFDVEARQRMWRGWLAPEPRPGARHSSPRSAARWSGSPRSAPAATRTESASFTRSISIRGTGEAASGARCWSARKRPCVRRVSRAARLWVMEGNERAERFYQAAGWVADGGRKVDDFQGAEVVELRYSKRL